MAFVLVATVVGACAWLTLRPASYVAAAELVVNPIDKEDTNLRGLPLVFGLGDPIRTIQTAAAVVESRQIAGVAAKRLGAPWTAQRVLEAIEIRPQGQTDLLEVRATAERAAVAARLANEYARSVLQVRAQELRDTIDVAVRDVQAQLASGLRVSTVPVLEQRLNDLEGLRSTGDPSVSLAQLAVAPTSRSGPPDTLVLAVALIVGAGLAAASAQLIDRVGPGLVLSEDDVAPLPVLSQVPNLARSRQHPTPKNPSMDPRVVSAFQAVHVQLKLVRPPPRTVMVASPSRGDGRTTTALNLAVSLAESGARVILVDLDLAKPDLFQMLDQFKQTGLGLRRKPEKPVDQILGVSLLPSGLHQSLRFLDLRTSTAGSPVERAKKVREVIVRAADSAEFVIVDTPPLSDVGEAVAIAEDMGALVLVARVRHTTRGSIDDAHGLLRRARREPTGCLLIGSSR